MNTVLFIVSLILVFPFWAAIHELSHILFAKLNFGNISPWKIILWPHKHEGRFYWARCSYMAPVNAPLHTLGSISEAPRVADFFIGLAFVMLGIAFPWALVFVAGAIIDIFVGTLGISPTSDLKCQARGHGVSAWVIRATNIIAMAVLAFGATMVVLAHMHLL